MHFTLYEEFLNRKNLEKLRFFDFPVDVVIASNSLKKFKKIETEIKEIQPLVKRVGYWPILRESEGYWLSPFAEKEALLRVINELKTRDYSKNLWVHWDAEIPLLVSPKRMVKGLDDFKQKLEMIKDFLKNYKTYNIDMVLTEVPYLPEMVKRAAGIGFNKKEYNGERVIIAYTSLFYLAHEGKFINEMAENFLKNIIIRNKHLFRQKVGIGLGCLDKGLLGYEPILNGKELERDLRICKAQGIKKIYLYKLSGINKKLLDILRGFYEQS